MKDDKRDEQQSIQHSRDVAYDERGEYFKTCKTCGKKHTLFTQTDDRPEYYTTVSVLCDCGEKVEFLLPVN